MTEGKEKKTKLSSSDFVHLHNHTQYSLLDGLTKIPELMDAVQAMGMHSVAITDHGTLSGLIEFYKEANARSIKPILGLEAYMAVRSFSDKDPTKDKNNFHLTLLAMNQQGYQNLMRLSTIANLEGFYYRPRIDHTLLKKYSEGLIVLSGCIGSEVGDALRQAQYEAAKKIAQWYKSVFGDRYYLEVQDHGHPSHPTYWKEQEAVNQQLLQLAKELDIACVVTCDAHYLRRDDQEAHEVLLCVQTGSFLSDEGRMSLKDLTLHVTDPKEVIKRWGKENPELITNTHVIAERCEIKLELGRILIPKFPVPQGQTERSHLELLTYQGLAWRYGGMAESKAKKLTKEAAKKTLSDEVRERAEYELGVIEQMGFCGYFLIIADFINWGKNKGIVFGPGRGSAAGSIISYALKITELDPLAYDLLFERFLNPDRISMPDIDIDIQDSRRDEVIQYCVDKYGTDRVANIVTFGRMAARNAVRDVARVLQVPYAEADKLAKMLPQPVQGRHIPLSQSLKQDRDLKEEYRTNESARRVFDLAIQLEGTIRSHGVHAAGVVIAPDEIVKFTPLEMAQKGVVATQYSMGPIEDLGLLKMDFLGLSNLTIIKNALRIIRKVYDKQIVIDQIPLDDAKTYELFQHGDTTGVFQFESAGMKRYLKELQPTEFNDLIAMNALYRPGPMQWIEEFIARKNGKRTITYLDEVMRPALEPTYGIMVYQEQVMQIAKDMCGFSGGQADTLRKAIGKKKRDVMAKLKQEFITGATKTSGVKVAVVEKLWAELEKFADYAFPKAHSSCYATVAYWTAYLKANYPPAFMAALMTSDFDNTDRLAIEINECKHMGIEVLPPDVNESFVEFAVLAKSKQIRFGLAAIKNVGTAAVEEILRARDIDHEFANLEDFFAKVNARIVNRKTIESLIKAGALDSFGKRTKLLSNLDALLAYASRVQKAKVAGQTDLFGDDVNTKTMHASLHLENSDIEINAAELLRWERDLLGIYLSQHPLDQFETLLGEQTVPLNELQPSQEGKRVTVGGAVTDVREVTTKRGQKMAFVKLADKFGEIELILFPGNYQQQDIWERDRIIIATGKITSRDRNGAALGEVKILVDDAHEVNLNEASGEQLMATSSKAVKGPGAKVLYKSTPTNRYNNVPTRVYLRLMSGEDQELLLSLKQTIDDYQGDTEVVLVLGEDSNKQVIKLPMRINSAPRVLGELQSLLGEANVKAA